MEEKGWAALMVGHGSQGSETVVATVVAVEEVVRAAAAWVRAVKVGAAKLVIAKAAVAQVVVAKAVKVLEGGVTEVEVRAETVKVMAA